MFQYVIIKAFFTGGLSGMYESIIRKVLFNMLCRARQCWEHGIAAMALAELGETDMLLCACDDMITRQNADGRLCTVENTRCQTDPSLCVIPLINVYQLTGESRYIDAARRNIDFLLESKCRTSDGILWHILDLPEIWADSATMLPPALAAMGEGAEAIKQLNGILNALQLGNGLYGHRINTAGKGWVRREPWAAGNGWILCGIAWMLKHASPAIDDAQLPVESYRRLRAAIEPFRLPDGLFRDVLDNPASFVDCQCAAMTAYADIIMYESGYEDSKVVDKALRVFNSVLSHVDSHGAVHDCPGSPEFRFSGTSTEMQAFLLMLYSALRRCGAFSPQ